MDAYPLSEQQRSVWLLAHAIPERDSGALNLCYQARLRGAIAPDALAAAVDRLVDRHDMLRTRFWVDGGDLWQSASAPRPELTTIDVRRDVDPAAAVADAARHEACRAMDLEEGPPAFFSLVRAGDEEHRLLVNVHHVVADGSSIHVLRRDLAALYTAALTWCEAALPPPGPTYAAFVAAERRDLETGCRSEADAFWDGVLRGEMPPVDLDTDFERPRARSFRGDGLTAPLAPALLDACRRASFRLRVPISSFLLAALVLLLGEHTGQRRLVIGTSFAGRQEGDRWRNAVGFFTNTVPLVLELPAGTAFGSFVRAVSARYVGAYEHQRVSMQRLIERLAPPRPRGRPVLFQVVFSYQATPFEPVSWGDATELSFERVYAPAATFELLLHVMALPGGTVARFDYCADLFSRGTIAAMAARYLELLAECAGRPHDGPAIVHSTTSAV